MSHTAHDVTTVRGGQDTVAAEIADEVVPVDTMLLVCKSSRLTVVTHNDYVPEEVGATPLDRGLDAPRARIRAVFIHTAFNPAPIQSGQVGEPTTAASEVPSALGSSTPGCDEGNEGDSVEVHIMIISRPESHAISGDRLTTTTVAEPGGIPPGGRVAGSPTTYPATGSPIGTTTETG